MTAFQKWISGYWQTSLEDYYYFTLPRNLGYLFFTLLTGFFTFAAFKFNELFSPLPGTPLSVILLYAWEAALNFGLCLYMMDEWLSRVWKGWGDFENRTVGKVWLIWFSAFGLAVAIQYLIITQIFELYDPKMRWAYSVYPQDRPSYLLGFVYYFLFWLIIAFSLIQIAIKRQSVLENEKSNLEDLIRQREWVFKQNFDPQSIAAVSKARNIDKIPAQSELMVLTGNQAEKIDMVKISHINVEDHYCRIFVKEQEGFREFYVKISLKEILDQLPRDRFLQIHRSHIVNLAYVTSLIKDSRSYQLALDHGTYTLPISRYRLPQVLSKLEKLTS